MPKMIRVLVVVAAAVFLSYPQALCAQSAVVSEDDALMAFVVTEGTVIVSQMLIAFGQELEGVTMDESGDITYDHVSLAQIVASMGQPDNEALPATARTTMSGIARSTQEGLAVDLQLDDGPVRSIEYTLTEEMMGDNPVVNVTVIVNGTPMDLVVSEESLRSMK